MELRAVLKAAALWGAVTHHLHPDSTVGPGTLSHTIYIKFPENYVMQEQALKNAFYKYGQVSVTQT
eukprot:6554914-Pyramimonas_sp.AAC.1